MSKTDKDRPYWVRTRESGLISHDHRSGVCVIDEDRRNRWVAHRNHYRVCAKRVRVEFTCTKDEPYRAYRGVYPMRERVCWISRCACPIPDAWKRELHGSCVRERVGCIGHVRYEYHADTPCVCDDFVRATCFPEQSPDRRFESFGGGGVPGWFVNAVWHAPERRRERDDLRDAARAFNAGEDLEDFDFPNPQARNRGRYYYH